MGAAQKSVSGQQLPQILLPQIRGSSSHNNEIKMIRRGHYSSNNFQDSNKRKSNEKKILGYLPRVFFFNAFELGAESGNQVISSDEASSSSFALRIESKSNFFILLGKCSIPFLSGN
jgi:hypothetical protein